MITNLLKPEALIWLIPILAVFIFLFFRTFVRDDISDRKAKTKFRVYIFISRLIIFTCLVLVIAQPFGEVRQTTPGNPKITILVDNSSSMKVMNTDFIPKLKSELEGTLPISVKTILSGEESALGDSLMTYLEKDTHVLLISDGNANKGTALSEVAALAANLNSTISAIDLKNKEKDAAVSIEGVGIAVSGVNNTFTVRLPKVGIDNVKVKVTVDNEIVIDQETSKNSITFQRSFSPGDHKMIAQITSDDYFKDNNIFYKVVSVVKKPKILLVADAADPAEQIFNELYDVEKASNIPANLDSYYAIILDDMPASKLSNVDKLADYLVDKGGNYYGNGLFVIGGFDSFDRGDYKNSLLESYLPVTTGKAAKKRGSSNIVVAIDFSGTTGGRIEVQRDPETGKITNLKNIESNIQDVNKALAISVIKSLGVDNTVGVTVFNTQSAVVSDLQPLFLKREEIIDKISKIAQPPGQSFFQIGISGAYALIKNNVGTNNIILITDGNTGSDSIKQQTLDAAKTVNARGVKVYVVGTGRNVDEAFLKSVAYNGGGVYFPASQQNNLKILFGEPEETKFGELFDLFVLNPYHFITQGLAPDASLYGFNQVVPKSSAQLLLTTQHGEPALTVWNYGLGRVASLNVFSGNNNLGDLMNKKNSILLTRTANWVIGDPQRKEPYYVIIEDSRINDMVEVIVKSDKYPSSADFRFTKIADNQYKTDLRPTATGFGEVLSKSYAVNYPSEYGALGMNADLEEAVALSGGKIFKETESKDIITFVKSVSKKTKIDRTIIVWPFLLAAAILFLIEIFVRRIREKQLNS